MSILAAGAGLLGNVIGGLANHASQKSINQMNNEFNAVEAQKSRDFQLEMWNRQNDYNSPSQQRSRLEAAGLNPYMMLNGGNAGEASNAGSAQAASGSPGSPPFSSEMGTSFVSQLLASRMTDANVSVADSQSSLNKTLADKAVGDTDWSNYSPAVRKWLMANSLNRQMNIYTREQNESQNAAYQGFLMQAQAAKTLLDGEAQKVLNRFLPEVQQAQLGLTAAQIVSLQKSGQLSDARALESLASRMKMLVEAEGKRVDNRIARSTAQSLINSVNASNQASAKYAGPSMANDYLLGRAAYRSAKAKASVDEYLESRKGTSYWLDKGSSVGNAIGNVLPKRFK